MDRKLEWISRLIETEDDQRDPDEFMNALKTDIFHDEVFVFTPKGDVVALPNGANVIDFAYAIHSAVGDKMIGGKINGMIVPIDRVLQNGEIVEIITSGQSRGPSRDWLKIVKTSEAKNKIRQWFKKEKRTENIAVGKSELDRELKHYGISYTDAQYNTIMANLTKRLGLHEIDDLYNTIGYGGMSVSKIAGKLRDAFDAVVAPEPAPEPLHDVSQVQLAPKVHHAKHFTGSVIVDGVDGCQVKYAKCCNPLPGDKLIAFVTKGFGISVHKADCVNIAQKRAAGEDEHRFKDAQWVDEYVNGQQNRTFEAVLHITAVNSYVLIAEITMALADMRVSITQINSQKHVNGSFLISLTIACKNVNHFKSIVARLKNIPAVESVSRGLSRTGGN
jgi:GTP pyrophosphokinase